MQCDRRDIAISAPFRVEKRRLFLQCISTQILCIFDVHCSPSSEPLGKKKKAFITS